MWFCICLGCTHISLCAIVYPAVLLVHKTLYKNKNKKSEGRGSFGVSSRSRSSDGADATLGRIVVFMDPLQVALLCKCVSRR